MTRPMSRSSSKMKSPGDGQALVTSKGHETSAGGEESPLAVAQERLVVGALFCGYFGREFCALHLYTIAKLWQAESGVGDAGFSFMVATGHVVGSVAKIVFGFLADSLLSGKAAFLIAALGSALCTVAFGLAYTQFQYYWVWLAMHIFIPGCWVGLVAVVAESVAAKRHGKTLAFVSLAFVGGDAAVRAIYGALLKLDGFKWRYIFYIGGIIGALATIPIMLFIKPKPRHEPRHADAKHPPSQPAPMSPRGKTGSKKAEEAPRKAWFPMFLALCQKPPFILVCLLSFMLRAVRAFFMSFTVPFLVEVSCRSSEKTSAAIKECLSSNDANSRAVLGSVLFPLTGVLSTIICGILNDRLGQRRRALMPITFLSLSFLSLAQLARLGSNTPWFVGLVCLVGTGFGLFGPYTLLAGAFAIDVGGEEGAATASALIDSTGTLGAICITALKGFLGSDWGAVFGFLVSAVGVGLVISFLLLALDRRAHRTIAAAQEKKD